MNNPNTQIAIDSESVKNCWLKIKSANGTNAFVDNFYTRMFDSFPETRSLFPANLVEQKSTLLATLDSVITGIDYIEDLKDELIELGRRHKKFGINEDMYVAFIITVVECANITANFKLTDKELEAWETAFREVTKIMLKAY